MVKMKDFHEQVNTDLKRNIEHNKNFKGILSKWQDTQTEHTKKIKDICHNTHQYKAELYEAIRVESNRNVENIEAENKRMNVRLMKMNLAHELLNKKILTF